MNKYRNKRVTIDGITFMSLKESKEYVRLKLLEKVGKITDLKLQPKYELQPSFQINGKTIRNVVYIADFSYWDVDANKPIIEDVKASRYFTTDVYKLKKKLFMYKYKVEITEIC